MTIYSKGISCSILTSSATDEGVANTAKETSPLQSDDNSLKKNHLNLQQLENSKKNTEEWNTDVTGQWGTHWDIMRASDLQSNTP